MPEAATTATAAPPKPPNRKQIRTALSSVGLSKSKIDPDVLSKCVALASTLHLTAEQMAEVWEAYSLNKQGTTTVSSTELTARQFDGYKNELIKAADNDIGGVMGVNTGGAVMATTTTTSNKRTTTNAVTPTPAKRGGNSNNSQKSSDVMSSFHGGASSSSSPQREQRRQQQPPAKVKTYQERTNVGQVVTSYTPSSQISSNNNNSASNDDSTTVRCLVTTNGTVYVPNNNDIDSNNDNRTEDNSDDDAMMVDATNADNDANADDGSSGIPVGTYNVTEPYRHMFTTMEDRADQLERHLVRMKQQLVHNHHIQTATSTSKNATAGSSSSNDIHDMNYDDIMDDMDDDIERIMMEIDDGVVGGGGTTTTTTPAGGVGAGEPSSTAAAAAAGTPTTKPAVFTSTLGEVHVPRQDLVTVVGRVCNEAHEGRLNATSIVLEGSRSTSGGARINVDLEPLLSNKANNANAPDGYSLFPGQVVAMEGMNPTGRKLRVQTLVEGTPPPTPSTRVMDMKRLWYGNSGNDSSSNNSNNGTANPIKIMTACGPFTTSDNLNYEPLIDFLNEVLDSSSSGSSNSNNNNNTGPADVVILTGPFVDVQHDAIKSGNVVLEGEADDNDGTSNIPKRVVSHETLFMEKITTVIEEVLFSNSDGDNGNGDDDDAANILKTQFILVPSLDDATAHWVYPQPPLQDRLPKGGKRLSSVPGADDSVVGSLGLYQLDQLARDQQGRRRVHCMPNPCTFQINDVVFGVTSTDVIFQMSVEETSANLPAGSRVRRIAQHMVQQQSYYPMFPPAKSVNMDLKQQDGWRMPVKADVLIAPTRLNPFCSPVMGDTVVVNPGHLTKRTTGGTYAIMELHPPMDESTLSNLPDSEHVPHNVQDRLHVQVKRI